MSDMFFQGGEGNDYLIGPDGDPVDADPITPRTAAGRTEKRCRICRQAHWRVPAGWIADHVSEPVDMPIEAEAAEPAPLDVDAITEEVCDWSHAFAKHTGKSAYLCPMWDQHKTLAIKIVARLAAGDKGSEL